MDRLRVLLLTLPIPEPLYGIQRGNHQLFAHFFKNFLRLRGDERFEILTLPRPIVDMGTNEAVVDGILERRPDVAGFSLYLWNVERSIDCARMLARADAGLITVGGGPEVQDDNGFLLGRGPFDFLVKGEGEIPFLALLDLLFGLGGPRRIGAGGRLPDLAPRLAALPSLFVRGGLSGGERDAAGGPSDRGPARSLYVPTAGQGERVSVAEVQKGIVSVYDEYREDDFAYLELVRGCPFACDFCSYSKNREGVSRLPLPLALDSIRALVERDVGEIYLLAPTANFDRGYFRGLLDGIAGIRREFPGCRTKFFSELRMELLDGRDVEDMIGTGFSEFEVGIQTLRDERVLDRVEEFVSKGAHPLVDFILGLPGDDYARCIKTVEALDRRGLLPYAVFYHLLVLPGSPLRETALERGYGFCAHPPYHVLRTDLMDIEDIRTVYLYLEHQKHHSYYEAPVYTDPGAAYTIRRGEDAAALLGSRSLKTGSLVAVREPAELEIGVERIGAYVEKTPEVFHHAFVLWGEGTSEGEGPGDGGTAGFGEAVKTLLRCVKALRGRFSAAGNYFDRYCTSLDYLGGESFSKRVTVLVDPFSENAERALGLLEEMAFDYAYGVSRGALSSRGQEELKKALGSLEREWRERGVYTVFFGGHAGSETPVLLEKEIGCPPGDADRFLYYVFPEAQR